MLHLDNASLSLGERHWTFDISLQTHGVHALLGRSGSGKSTLLNLIGGFLLPDEGDIQWQGDSLLSLQPDERPITTLFQQHNLFEHLTVWKNVALGICPTLRVDAEQRTQIATALSDVGLAGFEQKMPRAAIRWRATASCAGSLHAEAQTAVIAGRTVQCTGCNHTLRNDCPVEAAD